MIYPTAGRAGRPRKIHPREPNGRHSRKISDNGTPEDPRMQMWEARMRVYGVTLEEAQRDDFVPRPT